MAIPIYVVTGFLDSGKTTFLNNMFSRRDRRDVKMLLIQLESGEEEFHSRYHNYQKLVFPIKVLEQNPNQIIEEIHNCIQDSEQEFDEIWFEWNGVVPLMQLQSLILSSPLRKLCKIYKVIHVADTTNIENLLGRTGGALPEQIANSDFIVLTNACSSVDDKRIRRLLKGINPGVDIYDIKADQELYKQIFGKTEHPVNVFSLILIFLVVLLLVAKPILEMINIPVNTIINVFLGITLQAVPFLLIGVLLSSAIQIFVPQSAIERWFPKSIGMGMFVAVIAGFCFPVCDCASIPVFRSLVKKGIPLPVAITFMTAAPVINPVVILSTYYAFSGNINIVMSRVVLGIIAAVIIGLVFAIRPTKGQVLSGGALDRIMCSCGCYENIETITTFKGKVWLFIRHSQVEFFDVGKYLLIGTFVASVFQVMGTGIFTTMQTGAGLALSMVIMMVMAFVLSLCSSSDAIIARSFGNQFPLGAIMGFLVFGPMMDIKNVLLLSSGFSKRFIGMLILTALIVCFTVVFLVYGIGGI